MGISDGVKIQLFWNMLMKRIELNGRMSTKVFAKKFV